MAGQLNIVPIGQHSWPMGRKGGRWLQASAGKSRGLEARHAIETSENSRRTQTWMIVECSNDDAQVLRMNTQGTQDEADPTNTTEADMLVDNNLHGQIFVGGVNESVSDDQLRQVFSPYRQLLQYRILSLDARMSHPGQTRNATGLV
ncbi:hypothetical protein CsSME_00001615 [Camellia sinensis var. sinensis]